MKLSALLAFLVLIYIASAFASESAIRAIDCNKTDCPEGRGLTQVQVEGDALVKKFCTTCHTESRIMDSLKLMRRDAHGFEKNVKSIVVKKIRLTGGEISHRDGKKILEYLVAM